MSSVTFIGGKQWSGHDGDAMSLRKLGEGGGVAFGQLHPCRQSARRLLPARRGERTRLGLTIGVRDVRAESAPAVAGIALGWEQTLDKLEAELRGR